MSKEILIAIALKQDTSHLTFLRFANGSIEANRQSIKRQDEDKRKGESSRQ